MFRWYRKSKVCLAYLEDVSKEPEPKVIEIDSDPEATPPGSPLPAREFLFTSRWFKRGWTLQELIAPKILYFYDSTWNEIGEKMELGKEISQITGIDSDVLHDHELLPTKSIARRMSWASERETTRTEDIAYCLMGIFNVSMPLLYGEGQRAFIRLQEEIMRSRYDHSLFAWNRHFPNTLFGSGITQGKGVILGVGVLTPHPVAFSSSAGIIPQNMKREPYAMTNRGLQVHLRLREHNLPKDNNNNHTHWAILECGHQNNLGTAIAIPLAQMSALGMSESEDSFCRAVDQDFIEVKYSEAASLGSQKIYLLGADPLWSRVSYSSHRCWLREYGQELGLKFQKALYCEYPIKIKDDDNTSHTWNYKDKSMTWDKGSRGALAALYFSKKDGPAFVLLLTFIHLWNPKRQVGIDIHIKQVRDNMNEPVAAALGKVRLHRILVEHIPSERGHTLGEAITTFSFENRVMTARIKEELIFDENMFVVDLLFSGVKRRNSEVAPED